MIARSRLAAAALVLSVILAGCGKSNSRRAPAGHALPASPLIFKGDPGQFGGRIVLTSAAGPRSFNPLQVMGSGSDQIVRLLFSSLVPFGEHLQPPCTGLPS